MSESDDTDYLLLIPPNFFWVPSDYEEDIVPKASNVDRDLVDGLLSHVNNLESRVTAIESFDGSFATDLEALNNLNTSHCVNPTSVSVKRSNHFDILDWVRSSNFTTNVESNREYFNTDDLNDSVFSANKLNSTDLVSMSSPSKDYRSDNNVPGPQNKIELSEVDRLLKEMEVTQRDIENKLRMRERESELSSGDGVHIPNKAYTASLLGDNIGSVPDLGFGVRNMFIGSPSPTRPQGKPDPKPDIEEPFIRKSISLLGSSSEVDGGKGVTYSSHDYNNYQVRSYDVNAKTSEKSTLTPSVRRKLPLSSHDLISHVGSPTHLEKLASPLKSLLTTPAKSEARIQDRFTSVFKPNSIPHSEPSFSNNTSMPAVEKITSETGMEQDFESILPRKIEQFSATPAGSNKLLSLNELWKGNEETISRNPVKLKQKLEEERYRRLHLENTVQTLQRKILEEQEKLAVAIQVDEKKDLVIERVTDAWKKMVEHWKQIEEQRHSASQALLTERAITKRSQEELNKRVIRWEREVSQALDLAAGFKSKAEELEKNLSLTREEMSNKLRESEEQITNSELLIKRKENENAQLREKLGETVHQLHEERKITEETKEEMARVESSANRLEAELLVIKEQRDLLALRLKEETARTKHLELQQQSLESAASESSVKQKEAEQNYKVAKKNLESIKSELKLLYQSQLESVVKEKLSEFQTQLETARDDMRHQLDSELATARESARNQQHTLVNSHVAEMRRLESIHKEEMNSLERRLAEAESRCAKLELAKRDVAHKLHKVMENQWQQALGIITGELSIRQAESEFERGAHHSMRTDDLTQSFDHESPCKEISSHPNPAQPSNQNQLLKYIEMMLDKHPGRPVDTLDSSILHESTSELLDESNLQSLNWNNLLRPGTQGSELRNEGEKDLKKPPWK